MRAAPRPIRAFAMVVALATATLILTGVIDGEFVVPDLFLIGLLAVGAAVTSTRWSMPVLVAGFAYTCGVFAVSVTQSVIDDEPNWRTGAGLVGCVAVLVYLVGSLADRPVGSSDS